jgi:hypothetical protein
MSVRPIARSINENSRDRQVAHSGFLSLTGFFNDNGAASQCLEFPCSSELLGSEDCMIVFIIFAGFTCPIEVFP